MTAKNRHGAVEAALARRETYETGFKRLSIANLALCLAVILTSGLAWSGWNRTIETRYFALAENGNITPVIPISEPHFNNGQVTNFAVEAITRAMTMSFVTWRQDLSEASEYFERPGGWNNFLEALEGSGTLDLIRNRRLISSVVANGATVIQAGVKDGVYTWVVQVPITVNYQSSSESSSETRLAELEIHRLSNWETPRGMGISRTLVK